ENLRAVADAAESGLLDASRLRALRPEQALEELKTLPGIGDFFAQLILVRGVGTTDLLPTNEPRLRRAVALAYGVPEPGPRSSRRSPRPGGRSAPGSRSCCASSSSVRERARSCPRDPDPPRGGGGPRRSRPAGGRRRSRARARPSRRGTARSPARRGWT